MLDLAKKSNELKAQHERQVYELTNENFQKIDKLQAKWEGEKRAALAKLKEEIQLKNDRIKELEKSEKKLLAEREKSESMGRQLREIGERMKSLTVDRDILENEKKYLEEKVRKYDEKIMDLEYQVKKR